MQRILTTALALCLGLTVAPTAFAFCGFYVAKADTKLFNDSSRVVLARDRDRTVVSMANDYRGDPKAFAIVVPVPTVLQREQIQLTDPAVLEHLDAYTAPRLVEYHDPDPCAAPILEMAMANEMSARTTRQAAPAGPGTLGVTVEAEYAVGEYDIVILSAKASGGLNTWLQREGYKMPEGAERVLGSYIKQDMRFFLAKVNLKRHEASGNTWLRPLQIAYESKKFMLPIRLGTLNADKFQDLFIFALTRTGRVETTNYRTVRLPTGMDIPPYVKGKFASFYKDMFSTQVKKEDNRAVFLEYAWDMGWCDPCAADPLSRQELRKLGVFWLKDQPAQRRRPGGGQNVFVTRLHVRYDAAHFPEDLVFQETGDRTNFQGRYVLRHPYKGEAQECTAADDYYVAVEKRKVLENEALANLTGWDINEIRKQNTYKAPAVPSNRKWWNWRKD